MLTRADLLEMDPEQLRATATCYGYDDTDDLSNDQLFTQFAEFLDDLGGLQGE